MMIEKENYLNKWFHYKEIKKNKDNEKRRILKHIIVISYIFVNFLNSYDNNIWNRIDYLIII